MFDDEIEADSPVDERSLLASILFALACLFGLAFVSLLPLPKGPAHVR